MADTILVKTRILRSYNEMSSKSTQTIETTIGAILVTANTLTEPIRFVVASRERKDRFHEHTALGQCLLPFPAHIRLFENNIEGLPLRYNQAIEEVRNEPSILVFVHDDVFLLGFHFLEEIRRGLEQFDIIGVVGSRRRAISQPSWYFSKVISTGFDIEADENLSGIVGSGTRSILKVINEYGPSCQEVKLLDGLLIAARSETLISAGLRFDERFDFHFYDLDFCREAEARGLRMGTWNLSVIHEADNPVGVPAWTNAYGQYLKKWREPFPFTRGPQPRD